MAFDGTEGQIIDLNLAATWTANFRAKNPDEIKAHFFGRDIISKILSQEGCIGIRIFNALDDNGHRKLILVGTDAEENDQTNGILAEFAKPCPAICGRQNILNSDSEL